MKPVPSVAKKPAPAPAVGAAGVVGKSVPVPPVVRQAAAPRQWSPRALAAAVMLVLLGGLVVMMALPRYAERRDVLVMARPVKAGQLLVAQDLTTAKIAAGPEVSTIAGGDAARVVGRIARADLAAGVALAPSLVAEDTGFGSGQALVGLALKTGQMPAAGIQVGQSVTIVGTPGTAAGQGGVWASASFPGVVASMGAKDPATGATVLDVRVPVADAAKVARLASTGNLAVLALPVGE